MDGNSSPAVKLPREQRAYQEQIEGIGADTGSERRYIRAEIIVERTRKPAAQGHAYSGEQQHRGNTPCGLRCRVELADRQHVGGNDPGKPETEGGRYRKQAPLVLGQQKG